MTEANQIAGNYYDKFNAKNPLVRWMMHGFKTSLTQLVSAVEYENLLEIGCGEGYILELLAPPTSLGLDLDLAILQEARQRYPAAALALGDGTRLPCPDKSFDLVLGIEVLEHVHDPAAFLGEVQRIGRRFCVFSVPREPIWRLLNMARGRYWGALGNTPGHVQHWSSKTFVELVSNYMTVLQIEKPLPWTMVLCELR